MSTRTQNRFPLLQVWHMMKGLLFVQAAIAVGSGLAFVVGAALVHAPIWTLTACAVFALGLGIGLRKHAVTRAWRYAITSAHEVFHIRPGTHAAE